MDGPNDPEPGLVLEDGPHRRDRRPQAEDFDVIDQFVARTGIDLEVAAEAAALSDDEIARRLVDVDDPRDELVRLSRGLTPARLARVVSRLDPVEMMFALKKLRARRAPANQAHVTNLKENPALLAADAAEAAARGFAELETTVGVSRYAPLNAIAILVGSQTGRPGVMTQCAVEERRNLQLAHPGPRHLRRDAVRLRHRAGVRRRRRHAVVEGVPRLRLRLARRQGALHLRRRLGGADGPRGGQVDALPRGALPRGDPRRRLARASQNGSISCVALVLGRCPAASREILAENLIAAWLDLEVASGNDAIASHSEIRKTAKLMGQFLPGTDFVTSGYSVMPRHDNMFGGGNYDADDLDEWLTRAARLAGRRRHRAGRRGRGAGASAREAARAVQAVFAALGVPARSPTTRSRRRRYGYSSDDLPDRDRVADVAAADRVLDERISGARRRPRARRRRLRRRRRGDPRDAAAACLGGLPADLGDHRADGECAARPSTIRTTTRARARATGSRASAGQLLQTLPHVLDPRDVDAETARTPGRSNELHVAGAGDAPDEVVIAVGPAFGDALRRTIGGLTTRTCCGRSPRACGRGSGGRGSCASARASDVRVHRPRRRALSGSGIAIGLQSKGTAVIHRADLEPLDNLELFGMSPLVLARDLPGDRAQRGRLRAGPARSGRCRRASTTSRARSSSCRRRCCTRARPPRSSPGADPVELELP